MERDQSSSRKPFISLSLKAKIQELYEYGSFVMGIRYYGYKVNLYQIDRMLVEVFYNHKGDFIERIEPIQSKHSRMKFYLDQIKLPENLLS
jgi:hypothetical protein